MRVVGIDQELEPPPGVTVASPIKPRHVRVHPDGETVAVEWRAGRATRWSVWRRGALLPLPEKSLADVAWLPSGDALLAYNPMGRGPEPNTVLHRITRAALPNFTTVAELSFGLPQCCVEQLVVAPSGRRALSFLNSGQGEGGYELFSLEAVDMIERTGIGEIFTLFQMAFPPAFSPDERLIVAVEGGPAHRAWLAIEDDDGARARGGVMHWGNLVLHDVAENRVTKHRLEIDLAPGWSPSEDELMGWEYPENARFAGSSHLVVRQPDGIEVEIALPAPATIRLPGPR